ncbi:hypothetical protein [Microbacterium aurugineum]|uniref:hypothetical protein n=1 Tax=Microbacterium aurugineum TaxID=2851642 RepID=UPI0020BFCBBB|nr:hypothetical protein [Microbacterium aurugineum]MCK8475855.1 hypothetical protein [Microbacterium aurugineum]
MSSSATERMPRHPPLADQPNELWQSDLTRITLADGTDSEVIGWIDDHSRYMLHLIAHLRVTGRVVTDTFNETATQHGYPTATLGITQKNGKPFKPTTQRKKG